MNNKLITILNNKKSIIYGVIFGLILFLIYMFIQYVPLYSTNIKLYVRNIPKDDVINEYGSGPTVQSESGFSNPLFNLQQILESQELAARVYKVINENFSQDLKKLKVQSEKDWEKVYSKSIKTKIEPSTDIITVSFSWPNKENASKIIDIIVTQFKDVNLEIRKSVEAKQSNYLNGQVNELGNRLDNVRRQIKEYKLAHRITDIDNEGSELTKARVELEKEKEQLKSEISYNSFKLASLASQLKIPTTTIALRATAIGDDSYLTKLNQDLASAKQNYSRLTATFTDNYPDVIAAKNEINLLNNVINKRVSESLQNISVKRGIYDKPSQEIVIDMARAQAEKYSLKSRLKTLQSGIRHLQNKELRLPAKSFGLQELQKQEEALVDAYTTATQSLLEARIKENEIVDNIVSLGNPADSSFLMNIILMKFFGFLILGVISSISIFWITGMAENKWANIEEIEQETGFKVLGSIPWLKNKETSIKDFINISGAMMDVVYGDIVSSIICKASEENLRALTFISTQPFRSKTLIVPNIAIILAKLKKSVILVDTNFLEPGNLLNNFGIIQSSLSRDLLDIVDEINERINQCLPISKVRMDKLIEDAIIHINADNNGIGFYYLGANKQVDNVYEYVATQGFKELINYLKNYYEYVLIETPPKSYIFPEFSVLGKISDASIIIAAMSTGKIELLKTLKKLSKSSNKILGIIPREENSEIEHHLRSHYSISKADKQYK